jgi:hypothetical protein
VTDTYAQGAVTAPTTDQARRDVIRASVVTVSEIVCVAGTLVGVGVFGGEPVQQAAGGALSADATLIAPAVSAFSIWSVIYLGLAIYTVWQWLPSNLHAALHRRIGWLVAASMLLNAGWLLVIQAGWLWVSVVVILALVVVLGLIVRQRARTRAGGTADAIIVDGTFGLYVGWVSVATCANITAALVAAGVQPGPAVAQVAAALVLLVALVVGVLLARASSGNPGIGLAMAWGIGWISVGRLSGDPASTSTGVVAALVAMTILVVFGTVFFRRAGSRRVGSG